MKESLDRKGLALGGAAIIGAAFGAVAVGAFAIGALSVKRLAVQRAAVGNANFKAVHIEDLTVTRLHVEVLLPAPATVVAGSRPSITR